MFKNNKHEWALAGVVTVILAILISTAWLIAGTRLEPFAPVIGLIMIMPSTPVVLLLWQEIKKKKGK